MSLSTYAIHWLILAVIDIIKYSDSVLDVAIDLYTLLDQVITLLQSILTLPEVLLRSTNCLAQSVSEYSDSVGLTPLLYFILYVIVDRIYRIRFFTASIWKSAGSFMC
jgi:hypothetical protein